MEKQEFQKLLKSRILVLDGAMGTMLMKKGIIAGCAEKLNITKPEIIKQIHKEYAKYADIIITNTFGANSLKLKHYNLENKTIEINKAAVKIARQAAPDKIIAAGLGPLGKYIEPLSELTFDQAYEIYKEQLQGLTDADIIIIETLSDIKILKAAVIAAKETNLPIICSMTFQDGRTSTGTDIETYTEIAQSLDVDAICVNCSEGPVGLLDVIKVIAKNTELPIAVEPNAGLPEIVNNEAVYKQTPEKFARYAEQFYDLGINIMGGCCGTTPDHIKEIKNILKDRRPKQRTIQQKTKLCSRLKTITIEGKTLVVGERINPTGKKDFQQELKQGKTDYIKQQALQQTQQGASLLDVNVGVAGLDEKQALQKAVSIIQSLVDTPLVIDTSDPESLELALKKSDGKPLINSVNGSEKSLNTILPLAKKYGAAIIALALDESGIPKTKEKRIEIAKRIIQKAEQAGIKKQDLIVDLLVMTIATDPDIENILISSIKEIKQLGYKTILGVSNISHGLPNRPEINSKFLTKASKAGLDLAILNPLDNKFQENTEIEVFKAEKPQIDPSQPIEKQLYAAILYGDEENIIALIEKALTTLPALQINNILIDGLTEVGVKFNKKEYFLPQVLASASAMKKAFSRLKIELKKDNAKEKGTVLFATVENDIHDIGKNIVAALLESHNYKIIDLGTNVPKEKIIAAVKQHKPNIIGLSALMTTTVVEMEKIIKELREQGINTPVIIGGAVVTEDYAKDIKAAYSKDALSAVKKVNELII